MKAFIVLSLLLLQSCKTLEIAHADLNCLSYPNVSLSDRLTDEELNSMSNELFDKLSTHIMTYQQRIDSICELIDKHNELHND